MEPGTPTQIDEAIPAFRRFNRFYTRILGLLDEGLVQSRFSLAEARVLFELAWRGECGATEIASELNLDPGYLSRILARFQDSGRLTRMQSPVDARHSVLKLTKRGKSAFADLDRRSIHQAHQLLERLSPEKLSAVMASMRNIESALAPGIEPRALFILRSHRPGDMGWVVERHGTLYAQEYGWDESFEALVARIAADFITNFDSRRERCWIADREGERLGSIFLVRHPDRDDTAKLRLLLVEPSARGLGLGKALVRECIQFARFASYRKMTLWTQSNLPAALHLYQQAGFRLTAESPHHSFGKDLVSQTWDLDL